MTKDIKNNSHAIISQYSMTGKNDFLFSSSSSNKSQKSQFKDKKIKK
jgi:hypothetical protein